MGFILVITFGSTSPLTDSAEGDAKHPEDCYIPPVLRKFPNRERSNWSVVSFRLARGIHSTRILYFFSDNAAVEEGPLCIGIVILR